MSCPWRTSLHSLFSSRFQLIHYWKVHLSQYQGKIITFMSVCSWLVLTRFRVWKSKDRYSLGQNEKAASVKRNHKSSFDSSSALIHTWEQQTKWGRDLLYEWWRGCDSQRALLIISPSLLTEALPFMHTHSNRSQIAHWYSEVLISSWKCDGKRFS